MVTGCRNVTLHIGPSSGDARWVSRGKVASLAVNVICRPGSGGRCCRICRTTFHPRRASSPLIGWPEGLPCLWLVDQCCGVMLSCSTAAVGSVIHMPTIQGHHYHQTPDNYKHSGEEVERILNQDVFSKHQLIPAPNTFQMRLTLDWSMCVYCEYILNS